MIELRVGQGARDVRSSSSTCLWSAVCFLFSTSIERLATPTRLALAHLPPSRARTQYQVRRARLTPPRSPSQLTGGHLAVGALCGKESHFSELSGAGHTLNESASSSTPLSRPAKPLGGAPAAADSERREAMLAAAEARSQSVRLLGFQARNSMLTRATGKQTRGAEWRRQAGGAARCSTGGRGTGAGSDRQGREDQGGPARGELSFRFDAMGEGC